MDRTSVRACVPRIALLVLTGAAGLAVPLSAGQARNAVPLPAPAAVVAVDYNWDVRPILSEYCFRCHGPDEKARRGGLRLDTAEGAYAALRGSAPRHAIVPGDPEGSELVRRIESDTPALRMPPASTNKAPSAEQVATLRRWISQGARYKPHWAFLTPSMPALPPAAGAAADAIDRFVASRLAREGLSLAPEADRETLINRVTLTLTGLPPTLAEVDAFVDDRSPGAYERVVDRLLASPAYGEHMARYWLDIARYAESDGFLDDQHDRLFWPYRDWVISAFNRNLPFDRFATWQIAGDLLPSHTREQVLATAFLRVGKRTSENGAIDEEYRVEYMVDRTNTIGTAFLGLTVGCARCHDHKYDPISHKDFYALGAFFNSTDEPGYYTPGSTGVTAGPTIGWADPGTEARLAEAERVVTAREAAYRAVRVAAERRVVARATALLRSSSGAAAAVDASLARDLVAHYPFEATAAIPDDQLPTGRPRSRRPAPPPLAPETAARATGPPPAAAPPGQTPPPGVAASAFGIRLPSDLVRDALVWSPSTVAGSPPAVLESPQLRGGIAGKAFYFDDTNRGILGPDVGYFERSQPFSLDFWILAAQVYDDSVILNNRENDFFGNAGYQVDLEQNRVRVDLMHSRAGNRIRVRTRRAVEPKAWTHVTVTYDGSSRASGVTVYLDGVRADVEVVSDNLTRSIVPNGGGTLGDEYLGLAFGKRFRMTALKDGALDEVRVFRKALRPAEVRRLEAAVRPAAAGSPALPDIVAVLADGEADVVAAAAKLVEAREAQNQIISRIPEVMVMGDTPTPRQAYVLLRGQYTERGEPVSPRGLSRVFPWNESWPQNRLGLARWLFDPKNPLTARVFVNRLWQQQFGRGLVDTSEDFGSQGAIPSHPELLDWLAVTFRESGWDIKRMQKRLVMSATFRQRSDASAALLARDPRNELLARFQRVRMPAELVRDQALAAAGLLVTRVGGPSTYPYQPPGIWDGLVGYVYPAADAIPPDDHHRRTMYSFVKRNAPHPAVATFDMPDRGASTVRRQTSNTPLQALVLLNDVQYLEAYRALATRVMRAEAGRDERIILLFRLATRRRPRVDEMGPMQAYYDGQVARYAADRASATRLAAVGVSPVDLSLDVVQLAAVTNLAAAVMNTPDAYSLR